MNIGNAQLKDGWKKKVLGEICDIVGGGTPSKAIASFYNGCIPWATVRDMQGDIIKITECTITEEAVKKSSTNIIPKGNVVIATRVGLGKVCLIEKDTAINQDLRGIIPKNNQQLSIRYLFQWLKSISNIIVEEGTGATVQGVKLPFIKGLQIPLPPLSEQQRIVTILDEAFAAITKAKDSAEQNLQNAKELFESYLQSIFNTGNWEIKSVNEVCNEIFAGGDAPKDDFSLNKTEKYQIPIYANAVKERGLYGFTNFARVTTPSITIAARGSGTGHTEIRHENFVPIVRLIVLIPNLSLINLDFLKRSIDNLTILRSGSAIPQLTVPMIKEYKLPLPSLTEQEEIILQVNALQVETQKLEGIYQQKIAALEELKKTILEKAFKGELVREKEMEEVLED
jgi:type I restriction enzyme, S subunit